MAQSKLCTYCMLENYEFGIELGELSKILKIMTENKLQLGDLVSQMHCNLVCVLNYDNK